MSSTPHTALAADMAAGKNDAKAAAYLALQDTPRPERAAGSKARRGLRSGAASPRDPPALNDFDAYLTMKQVLGITSLTKASIYRAIRAGTFVKPYQLTRGRIGFRSSEIEQWMRTRSIAIAHSD